MTNLPTDTSAFLNALDITGDDFEFELGGENIVSSTPEFIEANLQELRLSPIANGKLRFFYGVEETSDPDFHKGCRLRPTAVLQGESQQILIWALDTMVTLENADVQKLLEHFEMSPPRAIPIPGNDGWTLVYPDPDSFYTLEQLVATYLTEQEAKSPQGLRVYSPGEKYGDAKVMTTYDEIDYQRELVVTHGTDKKSFNWLPKKMPVGALVAKLCKHEIGKKDGPSIVLADMHPGQRLKTAVKAIYAIGLDIDTGTPSSVVDAALGKLGCCAVRYTTHSHFKTTTEFKKDRIVNHFPDQDEDEVTSEMMQTFCRDVERWDAGIIDSVIYDGEDHTTKGIVVRIKHEPMPKHRIIVPLLVPFEIAKQGKTQVEAMAKWAKVPEALANLLGVPFDKSCTDPSRLFHLPRHDEGMPHEISLFGGPLFDWNSFVSGTFEDSKRTKKGPVTQEGKDLVPWFRKKGDGFEIVTVIQEYSPDKDRGYATSGSTIECPYDENHSNPGDQSDAGCFAINASDSNVGVCIVSCRHESCVGKSPLDMIAKMITDQWFERSVLDSPEFDALDRKEYSSKPIESVLAGGTYTDIARLMHDLKQQVSVILVGNKVRLIIEKGDHFEIVSRDDASLWFATWMLEVKNDDEIKTAPALEIYIRHQDRLVFEGITSDPSVPRRSGAHYTTWRGFALQPVAGDWPLLREHIRVVICSGNDRYFLWLMCWMAQMLQEPGLKMGSAVVLRGARGTGKTTLGQALRRIVGKIHSKKVSQERHVTGHFNQHLRDCLFLQVEEGVWGGNNATEGVLKDLVTSETTMIEAKGVNVIEYPSFTRLLVTSNEEWVVPAGESERRYFVLDVVDLFPNLSDDSPKRRDYFKPIYHEMDNGGLEAMMAELMSWDFSQVDLRQPPLTEGLIAQMAQTYTDEENWLLGVLMEHGFTDWQGQRIEGSEEWELDRPFEVTTANMLASYRDHVATYNKSAASVQKMLRFMKRYGELVRKRFTTAMGDRVYGYVLPPMREWRKTFSERHKYEFEPEPPDTESKNRNQF